MATPEAKVKSAIRKLLKGRDVFFWQPGATIYGATGQSDFICVIRGRILCIEAKAGKHAKPTPNQAKFMQDVTDAGGVALLIYEDNTEMIHHAINLLRGKA